MLFQLDEPMCPGHLLPVAWGGVLARLVGAALEPAHACLPKGAGSAALKVTFKRRADSNRARRAGSAGCFPGYIPFQSLVPQPHGEVIRWPSLRVFSLR